jgi:glycosyltransferase involved in cell wall biosynthesis
MRIAVDATSWFNARGYGRYTRELLRALVELASGHELLCFVDRRDLGELDLRAANVRACGVELAERPVEAAAASSRRSLRDMLRMSRAVRAERPDVLFFPTVYTYFPAPRDVPAVVTIHDTITERFPKLAHSGPRARLFWNLKVRYAIRQARLILTVSDFSAGEIEEVLGVSRQRIRVSGEAPAAAFAEPATPEEITQACIRAGVPEGACYLTYVGGFNPHKNVEALVRAHARLLRELGGPVYLLLVGETARDVFHSGLESIRAEVRAQGTGSRVLWPGFVPDEELRLLHAGALALVLPSMCEGFGLPAVEAAACGTPIVATTQSPLPALLEGGGIFVDPTDQEGLDAALLRLATDATTHADMGVCARERALALSWPEAARRTLQALEEAAA